MISMTKDEAMACGMGRGADCCIFIVVGGGGFECARESMGEQLRRNQPNMNAKRMPTEPIPDCRLADPN